MYILKLNDMHILYMNLVNAYVCSLVLPSTVNDHFR